MSTPNPQPRYSRDAKGNGWVSPNNSFDSGALAPNNKDATVAIIIAENRLLLAIAFFQVNKFNLLYQCIKVLSK